MCVVGRDLVIVGTHYLLLAVVVDVQVVEVILETGVAQYTVG